MTTEQPVTITRGEDVTLTGTVTDEDGVAVDISADAILFTVKNVLGDADASLIIQIDGTNLAEAGTFDIVIADTDTKTLDLRTRWYDAELITAAGARTTIARGRLFLTPDVTRA